MSKQLRTRPRNVGNGSPYNSDYALAQGLIDNLSNTEGGLVCREVIVYLDLCIPGTGLVPASGDWRQPTTGNFATATGAYTDKVAIYTTNASSARNDRKVYVAWGLRQVGSGPARDHAALTTNAWIWKRSDVKTIDQWMIQQLETMDGQAIYGQTPILYKRNDDMSVWVIPNARSAANSAKFDQLQVLMKVVESLGTTVMG